MNAETLLLLVDDDIEVRELQRELLEAEGFLVVTARDGRHALRLLEVVQPAVIVTDLMMPVLDGFGFMKAYSERHDSRAPIIAVSGFEPYLREAREAGARAALQKPVDSDDLVAVIRGVLEGVSIPEPPERIERAEREAARLRAVLDLRLDQPATEESIRVLVEEVARHFETPIAGLSIVTADRQRFNTACGLSEAMEQTEGALRDEAFCTHAVAARAALVIQDAAENPLFTNNPVVRDGGIRFYAGVPLLGRHGEALGTLCVLDYKPHSFTHFDLDLLGIFGRRMLSELEWRERRGSPQIPRGAFRYLEYVDTELDIFGKLSFLEVAAVEGGRAVELAIPFSCTLLAVPFRRLVETVAALRARHGSGLIGRLGQSRLGWITPGLSVDEARRAAAEIAGPHGFVATTELRFPYGVARSIQELEAELGDAGLA